jgi:16S rRNA (cytidine1402-2'-O)-methyltransferase
MDRFCFEGFLPRRSGERSRRLATLRDEERTMVFFESRHRLAAALDAMVLAFDEDRRAAACRELTKTHEEVRRGTLGELAAWARGGVLGEITIVVAGATTARAVATVEQAAALVAEREAAGAARKEAIAAVARDFGLPKRAVYAAVVARRDG